MRMLPRIAIVVLLIDVEMDVGHGCQKSTDPFVGDFGIVEVKGLEMPHSLQFLQPGVRDGNAEKVQETELLELGDLIHPRVRHARTPKSQQIELRQFHECSQSFIAELPLREVEDPETLELC